MGTEHSARDSEESTLPEDPELGSKDIRFLRAVREVNELEGYEPGYDERPPATTGRIAEAADLTKNEVNYRFNQRGFETDGGLGYIEVYPSELLENGALSAKRAELTERGEAALSEVVEGNSPRSVEGKELGDRLSELEDGIAELREETAALQEVVEQLDSSEHDGWDPEREEQFDAMLNAMIAYRRIFSEVFDIDPSAFRGDCDPSKEVVSRARRNVRESVME